MIIGDFEGVEVLNGKRFQEGATGIFKGGGVQTKNYYEGGYII